MDIICFTGHRDRITSRNALESIYDTHFAALWLLGGAEGFDKQVLDLCIERNVNHQIIRPDYKLYVPSKAPLIRNEWMVNRSRLVVACYDGRSRGGTYYTVNYAKRKNIPVVRVPAERIPEVVP